VVVVMVPLVFSSLVFFVAAEEKIHFEKYQKRANDRNTFFQSL